MTAFRIDVPIMIVGNVVCFTLLRSVAPYVVENQHFSFGAAISTKWPLAHDLLSRVANYRSVKLVKRCEPMAIALTTHNGSFMRQHPFGVSRHPV
jgi:hypothetical protein